MSLTITGKLVAVLQQQTGEGKNGQWTRQDFIIETDEKYPKKVCLTAKDGTIDALEQFSIDDKITVSFRLESREYNSKWYTNATAYEIK